MGGLPPSPQHFNLRASGKKRHDEVIEATTRSNFKLAEERRDLECNLVGKQKDGPQNNVTFYGIEDVRSKRRVAGKENLVDNWPNPNDKVTEGIPVQRS